MNQRQEHDTSLGGTAGQKAFTKVEQKMPPKSNFTVLILYLYPAEPPVYDHFYIDH